MNEQDYSNYNRTYEASRETFSRLSKALGIASVISFILFSSIPVFSFGFAALSILFAVLSKGYSDKMDKSAKIGLWFSIAAMSLFIITGAYGIYKLDTDPEYRAAAIESVESYYGDVYKEMYGEDFSDAVNSFFDN